MKKIWGLIGDAHFMRSLNGWLTIFWIVMIPISLITGWVNSVTYVSALSLWALVASHWSTWIAARAEIKADGAEDTAQDAEDSAKG